MATTVPNRSPLIVSPHLYLADVTGRPLDYGRVYFGKPNEDGEFYPIDIFSDKELTKPLSQPVYTKGGFLHSNGDMVEVFAYDGIYSVKVLDQYGRTVFYKPEVAKQTIEDATSDVVDAAQVEINRRMFLLDGAIATAAAASVGSAGWTDLLVNNADDKPLRNVIVEQIESISDLANIAKISGRTVIVKSYYAGQGKGGGTFVYDATKSTVNDGALVFNGWVRQLDSDVFTPYMSGCKCDSATDDAQNLDKLNLALLRNELKGRIVFDSDILINSELARTDNLKFVKTDKKVGVRLVGGVHYEIKSGASIKIGDYFDDSSTFVFCAANFTALDDSAEGWADENHQDDVHIFGGGTIDSTQAGGMTSKHSTERYLVMLGSCTNFKMYDITTIGGDYSNIIVSRTGASGARIYDNHFKDTIVTNSYSQDHSAIWSPASDWKVYNNTFSESSIKAQLFACAFESHGSEHYFYNNEIDGYYVAVLQCAFYWWNEAQRIKDNMYIYGNTSNSWYFIQFWFGEDAKRKFGFMDCFNNKHTTLPYVSRDTLIQNSIKTSVIDIRDITKRAFVSSDSGIAKDYGVVALKAQQIRNNSYYANGASELSEPFFDMKILINEGVHIFKNYIKSPKLFVIKNQFKDLGVNDPYRIKNFKFKDNDIDFALVKPNTLIAEIDVYAMNDCEFEVNYNQTYPTSLPAYAPAKLVVDDKTNSKNNSLIFTTEGQPNISIALDGINIAVEYSDVFATTNNNKIIVDMHDLPIYVSSYSANTNLAKVFEPLLPSKFKSLEIMDYKPSDVGGFMLPNKLFPTPDDSSKYSGVAQSYLMNKTSTEFYSTKPHIRASN